MYHEFTPCAALVPFIDKFWVFKGFTDIGTRFKILAGGCTDFIFSIRSHNGVRDVFYVYLLNR